MVEVVKYYHGLLLVVGNCCDNCFQVRVYYVESVYVERSIEHQELEGQIEMDWEIQVVVALLGSQTNFAEIKIPNHGPGLICVMCQLVVVTLLGSQTNFAEIKIPNHGPGLICVMCQLVVVTLLGSQTNFGEINIRGLICVMCQLIVVTWRPPCLFCLVGYNHQIYSNHFSFSCWIFVIFVSFDLKFNHINCPFQNIDHSGKAHSLNNTDIVTIHRSSLLCELTHSAIFFLFFEEQGIKIIFFDLDISEPGIK